jgi:16S rRNA (adenine1518-N6/adenine1519-N6)-dimethyltransferase
LKKSSKRIFAGLEAVVCANLPYYITTPILMRLLESRLPVSAVTVMVQREAAVRLCAAPGERACGAVSAAVRYYSRPEILFGVSAGSFMPEPKVDSCVIRLNILSEPPVRPKDEAMLFSVVARRSGSAEKRPSTPLMR